MVQPRHWVNSTANLTIALTLMNIEFVWAALVALGECEDNSCVAVSTISGKVRVCLGSLFTHLVIQVYSHFSVVSN